MDTTGFIASIVQSSSCGKHAAPQGTPCYNIYPLSNDRILSGVCNKRATKVGHTGVITPSSFRKQK